MWKNETRQYKVQILARHDQEQRSMVAKSGHETQCCRRFDKAVNQQLRRKMLTTLKIELLETSKDQLSINLIDCKNKLMGAEDSDARSPGRQSKHWAHEHREGRDGKFGNLVRAS